MPVQHVHSDEEFKKAITDTKFNATIVIFTATWCRITSPFFESLSSVYSTVKFIKVDVDELDETTTAVFTEICAVTNEPLSDIKMPTFLVSTLYHISL